MIWTLSGFVLRCFSSGCSSLFSINSNIFQVFCDIPPYNFIKLDPVLFSFHYKIICKRSFLDILLLIFWQLRGWETLENYIPWTTVDRWKTLLSCNLRFCTEMSKLCVG
jgi:hypothetical protein